jgi:hypothetical protein
MSCTFDRIEKLLEQALVTGIDFIHVAESQVTLQVHFHMKRDTPPATPADILIGLTKEQIVIHPALIDVEELDTDRDIVAIDSIQWIDADTVLEITTVAPGGFANYKLYIDDIRVGEPYNDVLFSFKANCESHLDCKPADRECPDDNVVDFPIDYQSKDFWSFRRALLDFASLRYPDWQDRAEADAGIMLAEVMAALGDELSYYQDRVAREAYLETATQRRTLRHIARLVDYEVHEGLAASTWLDITVNDSESGSIPAGADVWAESDKGDSVYFEVGRGLADNINGKTFAVDAAINSFDPHIWDADITCLPVGATELYINGAHRANLPFNDTVDDDVPCRWMVLKTNPSNPAVAQRRQLVCVIDISEHADPLVDDQSCVDITHLIWQDAQALPFEMELDTLTVRGNIIPATAGRHSEVVFVTGAEVEELAPSLTELQKAEVLRTVEREGADDTTTHLLSLPASDETPLCWLGDDARDAIPEVYLTEVTWNGNVWQAISGGDWKWARSFLGENASQADDEHFTLEDGTWRRVVGYRRVGNEVIHYDYASGDGKTIRFGDDAFGRIPDRKIFKIHYRLGNGKVGNIAADTLVNFNESDLSFVASMDNPFAAENGQDAETPDEVKQLAPEAFRAVTYRAVREEDYREAAERLSWVQRAGTQFRWTGSWQTAFVTPDPLGAVSVNDTQREALAAQMDRFRQAGREAVVSDPVYADIDLKITICVQPHAYPAQVEVRVLKALLGSSKNPGFFSEDNFTFGTPLRRSQLEATIQQVPGVKAVNTMTLRRRGYFEWKPLTGPYYPVNSYEVIRLENNPDKPEQGTLQLTMEGGA